MSTVVKDEFTVVSGCHSRKNKFRIYFKYLPYYSLIIDELNGTNALITAIRNIIRTAFGYRNFENFRLRVFAEHGIPH
ncbi:MAG: hypothetical protein D3903_04370 [Candidatus Electrothrix sp. GM3_4]|nr:hypothetical protein [Candidatus Electrothrix sp. GM3_4]